MLTTHYSSPVGWLEITADDTCLKSIHFLKAKPRTLKTESNPILKETLKQLDEYFAGSRRDFDLPLSPEGTAFQKKVWKALTTIKYGQTLSYGEIAKKIKNPQASRAVGGANNKNPISIVIPCHRVIGANNKLVGYGGGLDKKEILLKLENAL